MSRTLPYPAMYGLLSSIVASPLRSIVRCFRLMPSEPRSFPHRRRPFFFFFFPDEETVAAGAPVSVRIRSGETLIEQRLASLGTEPVVMGDDGNCQFRALSFQVVVGGGGRVESRSAISMSSHRISDESLRLSLLFLLLVSRSCKLSSSGRRTTTHMSGGASCST